MLTLKPICKKMSFGFADVIFFFKKRKSSLQPESQSWTCNRKNQSAGCWSSNLHPAMNSDFDRLLKKNHIFLFKTEICKLAFSCHGVCRFLNRPWKHERCPEIFNAYIIIVCRAYFAKWALVLHPL